MFTSVTNNGQMDVAIQQNLVGMLVKYEVSGLVDEVGIGLTKLGDAKHASLSTLELYNEEAEVEYSSKHEDSMEIQMVELVHASAKKARDVKCSYGRKF
jgi:hypothetical protein